MPAYTRFRLYITGSWDGRYAALDEIGMYESTDGTGPNLLTGSAVTASSTNGGYVPANAIDGNVSTPWESVPGAITNGVWIAFVLPTAKTVRSLMIRMTTWAGETPKVFTVQGSNDGINWQDIYYTENWPQGGPTVRQMIAYFFQGSSKLDTNQAARLVTIHDWQTGALLGSAVPLNDGTWRKGFDREIVAFVNHLGPAGYLPRCDGPVTTEKVMQ